MKKLLSLVAAILFAANIFAQVDEVTLVTNATGYTKNDAVTYALRSALEQTYGTFISSNTKIINDKITKDEIVSLSAGNITKYTELSSVMLPNNQWMVTVKATVSVKKLTKYAKSHGASCELAGNTLAQNMKLIELNEKSANQVVRNYHEQIEHMQKYPMYEFSISAGEPYIQKPSGLAEQLLNCFSNYIVPIKLTIKANANSVAMMELWKATCYNVTMSEQEKKEYDNLGLKYHYANYYIRDYSRRELSKIQMGPFRARTPSPELPIINDEIKNLKICYKNDHKIFYKILISKSEGRSCTYRDDGEHKDVYLGEKWVNSDYRFDEPRKLDSKLQTNWGHYYLPKFYDQFVPDYPKVAYFNLDAYNQEESSNNKKSKKTKSKDLQYKTICVLSFELIIPKEEMETITGFDIVRDGH